MTVRNESAAQRQWIGERLAAGDDWEDVAGSCAVHCQHDALNLMPWQSAPLYYLAHLDSVLCERSEILPVVVKLAKSSKNCWR